MKKNFKIMALVLASLVATPVHAEDEANATITPARVKASDNDPAAWSVGVGAGIYGFNLNVGYRMADEGFWTRRLGYRLDLNYINFTYTKKDYSFEKNADKNETINDYCTSQGLTPAQCAAYADTYSAQLAAIDDDDLSITATVDMDATYSAKAFGLLADFYPFTGIWRLTAGVYYTDFQIKGKLYNFAIDKNIEVDGVSYNLSDTDQAEVSLNWGDAFTPYIGTGLDLRLLFGLRMSFDVGVMFHSGWDIQYKYNFANAALMAKLDEETAKLNDDIKEAENDANDYKMWPQVKLGIAYQF